MLYAIVALLGMIYCHAKAMQMSTNLNHKRLKNFKSVLYFFPVLSIFYKKAFSSDLFTWLKIKAY